MTTGAWILLASALLAMGVALWRWYADGRFRGRPVEEGLPGPSDGDPTVVELVETLGPRLGERATLLQFSSAFCAPCRATRQVLADVAATVPGVTHVELDAEDHLDLVRRLDIRRTPTTLVLDPAGQERTRAAGAPRRDQVLSTLQTVIPSSETKAGGA